MEQIDMPVTCDSRPTTKLNEKPKDLKVRNKDGRNKKDDKTMDQVLKTISGLGSADEKFAAMCKKYAELLDDSKKQQIVLKTGEKQLILVQKQRDQLQAENSKCLLTRSRLESLCRELQKQNKAMKEETMLRIREEEEKRKEVSGKFQSTLTEITSLMHQNSENNTKLRDENIDMQSKFKGLCEQYELREKQVEQMSKQMKLEGQLSEARLKKAQLETLSEKEVAEKEKAQIRAEVAMLEAKCVDHVKTEEVLRAQISMYVNKYDDFQNVLARSNQVYSGFKGEMEKMSKKITRLEKETSTWKLKWENSHKALLRMATEKQKMDGETALITKQLAQLQKLCRTLQGERTALLQQLKGEGLAPQLPDRRLSTEKEIPLPSNRTVSPIEPQISTDTIDVPNEIKDDVGEVLLNNDVQVEGLPVSSLEVNKEEIQGEIPVNIVSTEKLNSVEPKEDLSSDKAPSNVNLMATDLDFTESEKQEILNADEPKDNLTTTITVENQKETNEIAVLEEIAPEISPKVVPDVTQLVDFSVLTTALEIIEKSMESSPPELQTAGTDISQAEPLTEISNVPEAPPVAEPRRKNKDGKRRKK